MFIKVVILLCVVVGVLSKVIPITNICESQEGILRCSYSGEGQYLSLQQLDNYREIHFTRFFHPSTLFVDNAKHLKRIIIHSGSVRCEDITTNNPEVLVTIAGIPCKPKSTSTVKSMIQPTTTFKSTSTVKSMIQPTTTFKSTMAASTTMDAIETSMPASTTVYSMSTESTNMTAFTIITNLEC
ncbi:unnamed protein product [Mytilus edulis]|uniref:Uncharacterized protein n=1 Tax=Mytilus edulis TaxID=6550 RepID=A0A8S3VHH3_MYTED|nr:unnamed protein product [Mytilus edulis]